MRIFRGYNLVDPGEAGGDNISGRNDKDKVTSCRHTNATTSYNRDQPTGPALSCGGIMMGWEGDAVVHYTVLSHGVEGVARYQNT